MHPLLTPIRFAAAVVLCCACAKNASLPSLYPASKEASALGVQGYRVLRADAHNLELHLLGTRQARLQVEVRGGNALQRLQTVDGAFTLWTSLDRITVEQQAAPFLAAERVDDGWIERAPIPPAAWPSLELLMAVDIDLAVQGTSMIFEGKQYAWCTLQCSNAARCGPDLELCAESIVTRGACLEQEP